MCCPISVKCATDGLPKMLLSTWEFRENRLREGHTFLTDAKNIAQRGVP